MDKGTSTTRDATRRMKLRITHSEPIYTSQSEDNTFGLAMVEGGILPFSFGSLDRIEEQEVVEKSLFYTGEDGEEYEAYNWKEVRTLLTNLGATWEIRETVTIEEISLSEKQEYKFCDDRWPEVKKLEENGITLRIELRSYRNLELSFYGDANLLTEWNEFIENFASSAFRLFVRVCRDAGHDGDVDFDCATYAHATRKTECDPLFVGSILSGGEEE